MVTLRQLHYLDALADTLHFGQAAEACAVTQPALSMQIKELDGECCRPVVMRIVKILTHWHYFSLGPAVRLDFASHVLSAQLSRIFRRNGKELPFRALCQWNHNGHSDLRVRHLTSNRASLRERD
jgi:hypothetical protein